jgi:hypothetical protein
MHRDLLQGAGGSQCSLLQPGVHLFNVLKALLKAADPLTEDTHFLGDRFEVLQASKIIRSGLAIVNPLASHPTSTPSLS